MVWLVKFLGSPPSTNDVSFRLEYERNRAFYESIMLLPDTTKGVGMTDNENRDATATGGSQTGFGKGPVLVAAGVAVALAALLIPSGIGVAQALSTPPLAVSTQAPSNPETGAETPVADPSALPDRDSDPTPSPTPADRIYSIEPGDTLTSISAKLGMSVDSIAAYNAVRNVDVISEGAVLRVPFIYVPPATDAALG